MEDYPYLTTAISNVITRLRENSDISKRKLAQLSGIDRVYLLQVEQGKYRPTLNFIFLLAQAFEMSAPDLVSQIEEERLALVEREGKP